MARGRRRGAGGSVRQWSHNPRRPLRCTRRPGVLELQKEIHLDTLMYRQDAVPRRQSRGLGAVEGPEGAPRAPECRITVVPLCVGGKCVSICRVTWVRKLGHA